MDELFDVVVDAPAFFHSGDDGGEIVIHEDHVGGLFGDIGSAPHGDSDVGGFYGGGIVYAIAGHGHDLVAFFEGVHDAELVLSGDPRVDADTLRSLDEQFI